MTEVKYPPKDTILGEVTKFKNSNVWVPPNWAETGFDEEKSKINNDRTRVL